MPLYLFLLAFHKHSLKKLSKSITLFYWWYFKILTYWNIVSKPFLIPAHVSYANDRWQNYNSMYGDQTLFLNWVLSFIVNSYFVWYQYNFEYLTPWTITTLYDALTAIETYCCKLSNLDYLSHAKGVSNTVSVCLLALFACLTSTKGVLVPP